MPSAMMVIPAMNAKKYIQSCGNCKKGKRATKAPNAMMSVSRVMSEKYTPKVLPFNDDDKLAAHGLALHQILRDVARRPLQKFFVHLGELARETDLLDSDHR